jgi:hypothetical protein
MSIQYVNIGTNPNDGTGDDLRSAFLKVNDNFQLLATIGGETNFGANLGGGSGQFYIGKTNEVLNFRTLAAGAGIALTQDGNVIRLTSTVTAQPNITTVSADNGVYPISSPNSTLTIRGEGSISTQIVGSELTINGSFSLSTDLLPELGGNLNLAGSNITGFGNINHNGSILTDNLTVGRSSGPGNFPSSTLLNGTLTVKAGTILAGVTATTVNASTSITAPIFNATGNGFVGSLAGNSTGTHYGNVAIRGLGVPDTVVVNTATSPATITGSHVGTFSGGLTATLVSGGLNLNEQDIFGIGTISVTSADSTSPLVANSNYYPDQLILETDVPTITDLGGATILTMRQQSFGLSESLRLRSTVNNSSQAIPSGTGIAFESVNVIDPDLPGYDPLNIPTLPEYRLHGFIGVLNHLEYDQYPNFGQDVYSTFVARVRREQVSPSTPYFLDVIKARGNGRVTIGNGIEIRNSSIKPYQVINNTGTFEEPSNNDLILLTEKPDTYINFYGGYLDSNAGGSAIGGYSFPQDIGAPGQVLQVRVPDGINPNNLLEWVTPSFGGGGGGGGVSTLLGLLDTPNAYLPGDGGKILVIKNDLSGIEFVNSITASLTGNVTGNVTGNASTATALQTTRTINGKNFNGTQNVTLTTADIGEDTNLYFTNARARSAISVTPGTSLDYTGGVLNIYESSTNVAGTLVKRTGAGGIEAASLKVTTIEKNSADTAVTFNSRVETASVISSTNDIITTTTLSAGFINLTGTGDQTLSSSGKLILSPGTSIDVSGKKITNLPLTVPTDNSDATSKKYVDDQTSSVYNASLQSFPLTGDSGGNLTVIKGATVTISGSTNINTSTTVNGVQISLKSTISGVSVSGNLPVSGTITSNVTRAGNINITNNEIQQTVTGNNINLVPGSSGGSIIVTGGDLKLTTNSRLFITGSNIVEVAANSLEIEIPVTTPVTFVRTLNWVDDSAALAYAFMNDGTQGQMKTIIMLDRGNYGNALDTRPRYLVLRGKINGASRTVNIAASDPNGSSTFTFLDGFWWRTANVA